MEICQEKINKNIKYHIKSLPVKDKRGIIFTDDTEVCADRNKYGQFGMDDRNNVWQFGMDDRNNVWQFEMVEKKYI